MKIQTAVLIGAAAALFGQQVHAHHSFAMFDYQKEVTVDGIVREFQWTNPHCWIRLIVADSSGKDVEWNIEGQSPNGLVRNGWTRDSIKTGDKAIVVVHPLKDGSPGGSVVRVSVNGQTLGGLGPSAERPAGAPP
jgi:hypothetical protein